jgi:hypothetical protein
LGSLLSRIALVAGAACIAVGAVIATTATSAFDPVAFGDRTAASLGEPAVARFAADRVTTTVLAQSPDLTAVRPLILATAEGLATTEPFQAVVRTAARSAHRALFSEGAQQVVLSIPDVGLLLRGAFERASPELAARIPPGLDTLLGSVDRTGVTSVVVDLWELRASVQGLERLLLGFGLLLILAAVALAEEREAGFVAAGTAIVAAGFAVILVRPIGASVVGALLEDPLTRGAGVGLWRTYMAGLTDWGLFLGGLGILFAGAATSVADGSDPVAWLGARLRRVAEPVDTAVGRFWRGLVLLLLGAIAVQYPAQVLQALVVALGLLLAFLGIRELFRLLLDAAESNTALRRAARGRSGMIRPLLAVALVAAIAQVWILTRNPAVVPAPLSLTTCNGDRALCERRVDEVSFAGAHNAMSNVEIPDWMFPHHQAAIPTQLREGVRALLIDIHYGYPGGSRILTDLDGPRPTREALEHMLGAEGVAAAERIRSRFVGAKTGERGLYFCHGFCEVGAYEVVPTLRDIRNFLLQHPGEVLILVVEDYVTPADLASAFEESGLLDLVYRGPAGPPWPTLGELVVSGQQAVVFIESGAQGVPWLHPAFQHIQETPYTFHEPGEFSCRANRGGADGSLFQINHWIETTPAPRPSNAEIVNAHDFLLARARKCEDERGKLPNVVAVDFYRSGDLVGVVQELNGLDRPGSQTGDATEAR